MNPEFIPFHRTHLTGREITCLNEALQSGHLAGDGPFTRRCHDWIRKELGGAAETFLTASGTAALEMSALLTDLQPGDEVILPSYTFVSTANAIALRGAVPVFVDIREDTLNLDERKIEDAITDRTRAILPVHYAGVACAMDPILEVARRRQLFVIEDAAQGFLSTYKGRALGTLGDLGALSFHQTKNIMAGEGGALLVNLPELVHRSEIIREKGTDRSQFLRGEVDRYSWRDLGSSYLPSDLIAAVLFAQLESARAITAERLAIWNRYHSAFARFGQERRCRIPSIPVECGHNAHIYPLVFHDAATAQAMIDHLKKAGIQAVFHYTALHSSSAGKKLGRTSGSLAVTERVADGLIRLPLWTGMEPYVDRIVAEVSEFIEKRLPPQAYLKKSYPEKKT